MAASRSTLRLLGITLLLLLCCGSIAAALSAEPDHVTLTWAGDPRTSQTITWRTDVSVPAGQIRLWEPGPDQTVLAPGVSLPATTRLLSTDAVDMNLHTVTVSGLKPATLYQYQVGSGGAWTGPYSFKKNWGFEPQPLHYEYCLYKRDSIPQNNPANAKYKLFIEAWRRMPLGLANLIGPHIVRNLG